VTHHLHHHWLQEGEHIQWHGIANRGADNTRQVGGILYLTDQRLFFEPHILERVTQEHEWQAPLTDVRLSLGDGLWNPHIPVIRDMALRYHLEVIQADGSFEDFWLTHLGEPLERIAHYDGQTST
jgi:hypothetical protein